MSGCFREHENGGGTGRQGAVAARMDHGRMRHGGGVTTPVYIAATGPRVMKVAGEVADGAVLMTGIHPNAVAEARELIADGANSAGRNRDEIETIFTCATIISSSEYDAMLNGTPRNRSALRWYSWQLSLPSATKNWNRQ